MSTVMHAPKQKSASKELARQQGKPSTEDLELAAEGIDVSNFLADVARNHSLTINFAESIVEGHLERSIEGASLISITVDDSTRAILRSGMFGTESNQKIPAIDVKVEGLWFRLASFQKDGTLITLEFEDRIVYYLKAHKETISSSRAHSTRAEFIGRMVHAIKVQKIRYWCPELHVKQPIEGIKTKKPSERERKAELAGGLLSTTDLTFEGVPLNKSQLSVAEEVLDTGTSMGANRKVMISSIMCIMQESKMENSKGHEGVDVGPFDQNKSDGWPANGNVPQMAEAYFKIAIENDKSNPKLTLAELVQSVQKSGAGASKYAPHRADAEKILAEYGEKGIGTAHSQTYVKEYDFHVGPPDGPKGENFWEASERLAKEVNWRRFVIGNTVYYVKDSDLMQRKPIAEFSEETEGIEEINGVIDAQLPVNEAIVKCRATRWFAPPGSVVKVKETGPFNGRWLVFSIWRNLFSTECEIHIHQPEAAKPEKAPETATVETSGGEDIILGSHLSGGTTRQRIVEAAKWGLAHKAEFKYLEYRPMAKSLFEKFALTHSDCSAFATLCYKAAGVKDPNGASYNGSGNTQTLRAHGNQTNSPQPGDLVFYKSPEHVAVYIGEGKVIELGGTPGPNEEPIHYRNDILEIRSYNLEIEPEITPKPSKHGEPPTPLVPQNHSQFEGLNEQGIG